MTINSERLSELQAAIECNDCTESESEEIKQFLDNLVADHRTMADALSRIQQHMDPDSEEENCRADNSEDCLDAVFAIAKRTLDALGLNMQFTGEPPQ